MRILIQWGYDVFIVFLQSLDWFSIEFDGNKFRENPLNVLFDVSYTFLCH